jgi:YD repeat-containing protein
VLTVRDVGVTAFAHCSRLVRQPSLVRTVVLAGLTAALASGSVASAGANPSSAKARAQQQHAVARTAPSVPRRLQGAAYVPWGTLLAPSAPPPRRASRPQPGADGRTGRQLRALEADPAFSWVQPGESIAPGVPADAYVLQYVNSQGTFRAFADCSGLYCVSDTYGGNVTETMNYAFPVMLHSARGRIVMTSSDCLTMPHGMSCYARWETVYEHSLANPPDPQTYGGCGRTHYAQNQTVCQFDPVNGATGAFMSKATDASLPAIGIPFAFSRSYTSADTTSGRLGPGWIDSYGASVAIQANGDALLRTPQGQQLYYTKQADGSFVADAGGLASLASVTGGYEVVRPDQVHESFDSQGRPTSIQDRNGKGVSLGYGADGKLATVTDSAGRVISFAYNTDGLLSQLSLPGTRSVSYGYTGGRLTSVTDVRGGTTTYRYDAGGRLDQITDPNSHVEVQNTYGADGRVTEQFDALGHKTTFAWIRTRTPRRRPTRGGTRGRTSTPATCSRAARTRSGIRRRTPTTAASTSLPSPIRVETRPR